MKLQTWRTALTARAPKRQMIFISSIIGIGAGFLNGLFGAGGGVLIVPLLKWFGIKPKQAHATSISIIFPLSILSTILYYFRGSLNFSITWKYLPLGLIGAAIGGVLMKKLSGKFLTRLFGVLMILSGIKTIFF